MKTLSFTILSDNTSLPSFLPEHGLSLALELGTGEKILFDTGSGETLFPNMKQCGIKEEDFSTLILSHGHYDHTGGVAELLKKAPHLKVYSGKAPAKTRFSCHPGLPAKEISMPPPCREALEAHFFHKEISAPEDLGNDLLLTGPIPRLTKEDTGGPFFDDPRRETPDLIPEETALLWKGGVLFQGCCHAGIGNTLSFCRKTFPSIPIHTIVGGLHLKDAAEERLEMTLSFLQESKVQRLILLHCTGEKGKTYLKNALPELEILTPGAGWKGGFTREEDPGKTNFHTL